MPTRTWVVAGPDRLTATDVAELRVQLVTGAVEIRGEDRSDVDVDVTEVSGSPLDVDQDGQRLTIGYAALGWDGWIKRLTTYRAKDSATLIVRVPHGTRVRVGSVQAKVRVADVAEDVSLVSASGPLDAHGLTGALDVRTVSGTVSVTGHHGRIRSSTVSGRSRLAGELPRADVATVSGAAEVTTLLPTSRVRATTISAPLTVRIPAGAGLVLAARSVSGRVEVDGEDRRSRTGATQVTEREGSEAAFVDLTTATGNLSVTRGQPVLEPSTD